MALGGSVSTKFAVKAGLLLLAARIDMHPVQAVLDPSLPRTTIAAELAHRLRVDEGGRDDVAVTGHHIVGIDHHEMRLAAVRIAPGGAAAPLTIGNDLLRERALELDFRHDRLHLLERRDVTRASRDMARVPLEITPAGCLEVSARRSDGSVVAISVASGGVNGAAAGANMVRLGGLSLAATPLASADSACPPGALALDWAALGESRVVIDLPDHALWIAAGG